MRILLSAYSYTDIAMVCLHFQLVPRCCILLFNNIFCIHFQLLSYTDIALVDRYCYTDIAIRISIYGYWYTHFAIRILSCGYGYTECIFHVVQLYAYFHGNTHIAIRIFPWHGYKLISVCSHTSVACPWAIGPDSGAPVLDGLSKKVRTPYACSMFWEYSWFICFSVLQCCILVFRWLLACS